MSPKGEILQYAIRLHFCVINNVMEYETLVYRLWLTTKLCIQCLYIQGNSEMVVGQVMNETTCQGNKIGAYCTKMRKLEEKFDGLELHHVLHCRLSRKDRVQREQPPPGVFVSNTYEPSVKPTGRRPARADLGCESADF